MIQGNKTGEIVVGKSSGFCFGVKRAAEMVEKKISEAEPGEKIYTLGKLIHNDIFNARLAEKGVVPVEEDAIAELAASSGEGRKVTLMLRAHGVTLSCEENLKKLTEK